MADVEQSLEPLQPPADGAKAPVSPQQTANAAQALVPPVRTQPSEADLLVAVPKPEAKKRNLRRSRPLEPIVIGNVPGTPAIESPVTQSQPIVIGNVPGTPVPLEPGQPEKKQPKNRKAKIGELLESDDEKENGGANLSIIANAGLLAGSK